jgi:hypothetical protein
VGGGVKGGEMTQTLYAHMNKTKQNKTKQNKNQNDSSLVSILLLTEINGKRSKLLFVTRRKRWIQDQPSLHSGKQM